MLSVEKTQIIDIATTHSPGVGQKLLYPQSRLHILSLFQRAQEKRGNELQNTDTCKHCVQPGFDLME